MGEEDFEEEEEVLPHRETTTIRILGIPIYQKTTEISGIPDEEDESTDPRDILDKQAEGLEFILNEIQEGKIKPVRTNDAGEVTELNPEELTETLRLTYKQLVALRGTSHDYFSLASLETTVAKHSPKEKAQGHYRAAKNYMNTIKENVQSTLWNEIMATITYHLWTLEDDAPELIEEAFQYATNTDTLTNPESANAIGNIYVEIAEDAIENKTTLYEIGIKYLTAAVELERTPEHLHDLGKAQASYAEDLIGDAERDQLLKSALEKLEESYKLKNNPEVREEIEEIKREM